MNFIKKVAVILLAAVMVLCFSSCGKTFGSYIEYGDSDYYSMSDIRGAAKAVKRHFAATMSGCKLNYLKYAGDTVSIENLEYCNSKEPKAGFTKCIVFESSFRSPTDSGGIWNPNSEYTWTWTVAKKPLGGWKLVSYGYG